MNKRSFLKSLALVGLSATPAAQGMDRLFSEAGKVKPNILASQEDFWEEVRQGYKLKPDYINLENGYYCMLPQYTLDKYIEKLRMINYEASYYMRNDQWTNKALMVSKLAVLAGCASDELIITRNTTESLDLIIGGYPWQTGDEAIMAHQDYGSMLDMFAQQAKKAGIVNKFVSIPNHPENDEEIVQLYEQAITANTKLLMICHMVNITGQILPVQKICRMAHEKGVEVMVDGAHAFGQLEFSIPELECDYYGSSLHKWLSAPLGAGLLYVRKGKANKIWPLLAESSAFSEGILRLNHTGTIPVHTDLAIETAIDYQNLLGLARKEARLKYLQNYWTSKARTLKGVIVNTPEDPARHGAIGNVGIEGMKPKEMAEILLEKYQVYTVAIDRVGVQGCRITPNVYTTTQELDTFVAALEDMA